MLYQLKFSETFQRLHELGIGNRRSGGPHQQLTVAEQEQIMVAILRT